MNSLFATPSLPLASHIFLHNKAKLVRVERDPERNRAVFVFDCTPEAGFELEIQFQQSQDCKLFSVRDSLLDRAIRVKREAEGGHVPTK